jgi:cell division protein FtsQ
VSPKAPPKGAHRRPSPPPARPRPDRAEDARATPSGPRPDARIAERRSDVRRAARHRRLAGLGALAVVVALVVSAFAALHSPLFAARHVTVTGADHERAAAVLAAAGIEGHPPLIDISTARAASGIDQLAWVASATVSRRWPESLAIAVTERTAVGAVALRPGGVALVDASGRVLARAGRAPTGLMLVTGVGAVPAPGGGLGRAGAAVTNLAAAIPSSLRPTIASVGRSAADGLTLRLSGGTIVLIGPPSELGAKFVALATLLANAHASLLSAHVADLRVPTSPVLTP